MKGLTLIFLLCAALLLVACGSSNNTATTSNAATGGTNAGGTNVGTKAETKPIETTMGTGVASCDEYLAKIEKCLNSPNVPEAARTAFKQSYDQNRTLWKQAASTPEGKSALETNCKAALDAAKASFDMCK